MTEKQIVKRERNRVDYLKSLDRKKRKSVQ